MYFPNQFGETKKMLSFFLFHQITTLSILYPVALNALEGEGNLFRERERKKKKKKIKKCFFFCFFFPLEGSRARQGGDDQQRQKLLKPLAHLSFLSSLSHLSLFPNFSFLFSPFG